MIVPVMGVLVMGMRVCQRFMPVHVPVPGARGDREVVIVDQLPVASARDTLRVRLLSNAQARQAPNTARIAPANQAASLRPGRRRSPPSANYCQASWKGFSCCNRRISRNSSPVEPAPGDVEGVGRKTGGTRPPVLPETAEDVQLLWAGWKPCFSKKALSMSLSVIFSFFIATLISSMLTMPSPLVSRSFQWSTMNG